MTGILTRYEIAARLFEPRRPRYASPLALGRALDGNTRSSPALAAIDAALVALMDPASPHDALMVSMPPQEGKSVLCSRRFPEWLLDGWPDLRIAVISYQEEMALRWGREIRMDIAMHPCTGGRDCRRDCGGLHIGVRRDTIAAGRWSTPQGGGAYATGTGGPLTGMPVNVLIVDDPVKDRADAESSRSRDANWEWFESVAIPRLAPGARTVLVSTRWHEDDLAGRIKARPSPLKWRELTIPAIAQDGDPLGREAGEELESVRGRAPGYFTRLRATMSAYVFSGIYQQAPTAAEGNFFRRPSFRYWRMLEPWSDGRERIGCEGTPVTLADTWRFITMDFAASTRTGADWTVASCWALTNAADLILLDRRRARVGDHEHFALAAPLLARWAATQVYVESGWWSRTFVADARDRGVPVAPAPGMDKDKVTRAIPAAGRVHSGKVWFPASTSGCACGNCGGAWLDEWCDELAAFPSGTHDDQVDTLAYAAQVTVMEWTPPPPPGRPRLSAAEQAVAAAHAAATGRPGELDIMGVQW